MSKIDWKWFLVTIISSMFRIMDSASSFNSNLKQLGNLGGRIFLIGIAVLFISYSVNSMKKEKNNLRLYGIEYDDAHLIKKITSTVGTVYIIIIISTDLLLNIIKIDYISIIFGILIPFFGSFILCKANHKNDRKYVTADNYKVIKKNVIIFMAAIDSMLLEFIISFFISTAVILYYLKPKKQTK